MLRQRVSKIIIQFCSVLQLLCSSAKLVVGLLVATVTVRQERLLESRHSLIQEPQKVRFAVVVVVVVVRMRKLSYLPILEYSSS